MNSLAVEAEVVVLIVIRELAAEVKGVGEGAWKDGKSLTAKTNCSSWGSKGQLDWGEGVMMRRWKDGI